MIILARWPGDRVQGHSRFLGFGDELRIPLQVIYLLQTTEAEKISVSGEELAQIDITPAYRILSVQIAIGGWLARRFRLLNRYRHAIVWGIPGFSVAEPKNNVLSFCNAFALM
jgi:hypothetical protein